MVTKETVMLLFNKWSTGDIEIQDSGLKNVIALDPAIIPISFGRHEHQRLKKAEVHIIERLVNKLMHFGKKYAKNTGRMGGKKGRMIKTVKTALDLIHYETGKNPVELLIRAIENAAPNEDTTRIVYGGVVYHVSVDVAPLRGRKAVIDFPFLINCTRTHLRTAELGCFDSMPTFSKTIPLACGAPSNGLAFLSNINILRL